MDSGRQSILALPGPYDLNLKRSESGCGLQKRQRAAELWAHTRRLLAKPQPTLRLIELAGVSGISKQAIHKTYGNRSEVIIAAINDYSLAMYEYGLEAQLSSNPVLGFVEAYAASFKRYPEYYSGTMMLTMFDRKSSHIFERSQGYAVSLIRRGLTDMQRDGRIPRTANLGRAASAVAALTTMEALEWHRNLVKMGDLRDDIAGKVGIFLRGLEASE